MKKRNLKSLSLNKKLIAKLMTQVKGAKYDCTRTKSLMALCPGCPTIPGMEPTCDTTVIK